MPKPLLDTALLASAGRQNRAHKALGPGHVRINAADANGEAEIYVYGEIGGFWGGVEAEDFAKEVGALDAETINVRINSPGGSVFDGVAIYNALAVHPSNIVVHIEGIAASIASVIAMAGDEIRIGESANVMIHKPWSFAIGDADGMRKEAEILDKLEGGIVAIYAARTGKTAEEIAPLVAAESWYRGQEAVDAGFADTMVPAKKKEKAARSDLLALFHNTPADLVPSEQDAPKAREFERLLRDGEGRSHADAKRLAVLAAKVFAADREVPPPAPRDEGAADRRKTAAAIAAGLQSLNR